MSHDSTRTLRSAHGLIVLASLMLSACGAKVTAPPEPPVSIRRGDTAFRYEEYGAAVDAYRAYVDQTEEGEYVARALYKTALAEYRLGRHRDALATLDELTQRYPKGHWVQVEALRGDAERELSHPLVALQAWDAAWGMASDTDHPKLRQRIVSVARGLNDVELARARRQANSKGVGKLLDQQIALRENPSINEPIPDEGEEAEELTETDTVDGTEAVVESAPHLVATAETPPAKTAPADAGLSKSVVVKPSREAPLPLADAGPLPTGEEIVHGETRVGCLLPLSGSDHEFGERAWRGLRLVFNEKNTRLVVKDSGSDPAVATKAFEELVSDPSVLVIIGPLRSDQAQTLAPKAEQTHVPLLLLSQRDGLNGRFAVQVGVTRSRQMGALLDYAMDKIRLRRLGVVYPKDSYGQEFSTAFRTEVERRGGTVVGDEGYPPGDYTVPTATIKQWHNKQNLEALFVPDDAIAATDYAAFLQREMPDVTLLGVHGWEVLADHGGPVNGVVFADGFFPDSRRPATREFIAHFTQAYRLEPGALEAQAYDAALLAKRALDARAQSRVDALRHIRALGSIEGATGELTVTSNGAQRNLFLLQVSGGRLREIDSPVEANGEAEETVAAAAPVPAESTVPIVADTQADAAIAPEPAPAETGPPAEAVDTADLPVEPTGLAPEAQTKVACLLPLTGPDRVYGQRTLAGLRLAFADAPEQLLVRDTGGVPASSAEMLSHLRTDPKVVAVVGPLRSAEAEVDAPLAERDQMPLLLLSQREGLAGRFAFQLAVTRSQQVQSLVRYAVGTLKLQSFGVAYPNDGYGSAFAAAFKTEVANQGGTIVGAQAYEPGASDFAGVVTAVRDWHTKGLDALFIPDAAATAATLATQARATLPNLALLGTESWNDPETLARSGSAINGAIFADSFFADSRRPSTQQFVERFQRGSGRSPTVFEAQAFDAGMAIRRVIADGASSRDEVTAQLTSLGSFEGAGQLHSSPQGFQRALSILRYRDGKVEEVDANSGGG